jgi:hypothetical protein
VKVVFWASEKPREQMLAAVFARGCKEHGDTFEIRKTGDYGEDEAGNDRKFPGPMDGDDVAIFFGVKGRSPQLLKDYRARRRSTVYLDKGYTRQKGTDEVGHTLYTRVAVNAGSPVAYMMDRKWPADRFERLGIEIKPLRPLSPAGHVIYASSSQKYHDFHSLGEAQDSAQKIFKRIRKLTHRQLVFRPKPSDKRMRAIHGVALSTGSQTIADALRGCHALVTYGSTAAMDAVLAGVPAIVLGDAIARPVAQTEMEEDRHVENPFFPRDEARQRWANAMAWMQWTTKEFRSGEAWKYIREEIERQRKA